jgi:hypothetical protein
MLSSIMLNVINMNFILNDVMLNIKRALYAE